MVEVTEDARIFKILKFAAEHEVFTGTQIIEGTGLSWSDIRNYASVGWSGAGIAKDGIFERKGGTYLAGTPDRDEPAHEYQVTYPAMMNWLDYIELKEARATSLQAQRSATKSVRLAIVAIIISSVLALAQIISSSLSAS